MCTPQNTPQGCNSQYGLVILRPCLKMNSFQKPEGMRLKSCGTFNPGTVIYLDFYIRNMGPSQQIIMVEWNSLPS